MPPFTLLYFEFPSVHHFRLESRQGLRTCTQLSLRDVYFPFARGHRMFRWAVITSTTAAGTMAFDTAAPNDHTDAHEKHKHDKETGTDCDISDHCSTINSLN